MAAALGNTRARLRNGRRVAYYPTSAEVTTYSQVGPYVGEITKVNKDGTVNLAVNTPTGVQLAKTSVKQTSRAGGFSLRTVK